MRKGAFAALLLLAGGCSNNDNVVYGAVPSNLPLTPYIAFDTVNSVISGRATLTDANGTVTGSAEVVIISDRPSLCQTLAAQRDYFRNAHEAYVALILFLPSNDRLGTFLPGRPGDEGTSSEIIGVQQGQAVAPFPVIAGQVVGNVFLSNGYVALNDWSESAGGEASGSFNLIYAAPAVWGTSDAFPFYGKFKSTVCTTLDGTQLP